VLLLERLDGSRTLAAVALAEAVPRIALVMNRLAVPAPPDAPSTAELVSARRTTLEREWQTLGRPLPKRSLAIAQDAGLRLAGSSADTAVNGDLHYDQLLRGQREPWLVVDPVLLRGDIEYDLARLLWTRLDEMADSADIRHWFDVIVATAGLDPERAWAWVVFRTVDYWLWGLANGLTEDPKRCRRLLEVFVR
jgi:streptomycin 6-kinase